MYISPKYRANLATYKYSGIDKSLMSKYVLGPYWSWLVEKFPLWMAPNLITFIGFNICLFNLATLLYFSPDLKEPCPNWVYFTFGIGLFAYQSLDAIDGKQARRTNSGGPLGELFDHGCDALNTSIGVLIGASMLNAHQTWWLFLSLLAALANFYMSTWEEYHTGTLYLSYCSGPVEGVILVVASHIFTGFVGASYWDQSLRSFLVPFATQVGSFSRLIDMLPDACLNHVLLIVMILVTGVNTHGSIMNVIAAKRKAKQPIRPAIVGLLPFIFSAKIAYVWLSLHPEIVTQNAVVFTLFVGVMFGYTVGTMITAHVTKSPFPLKPNVLMMILMVGATNAIVEKFLGRAPLFERKNEPLFLQAAFAFSVAVYLHFATDVIQDICHFKGMYCFKLGKRESDANTAPPAKNGKIKKAQ